MISEKLDFQKHLLIWYGALCLVSLSICFINLPIGISSFGSFLVAFLSVWVPYRNSIRELKKQIFGVERVSMRSGENILNAIETELESVDELKIIGIALYRSLLGNDRFRGIIRQKAESENFKLKICFLKDDPDNAFLRGRALEEAIGIWYADKGPEYNLTNDDIKDIDSKAFVRTEHIIRLIKTSKDEILKLIDILGNKLEVRFISKTHLLNSMIIAGQKIVVIDYLHQSGSDSPMYILKNNDVSSAYENEFDRMWVLADREDSHSG